MGWLIIIEVLLVLFVLAVWHCLNQIDEDLRILWDWVNRNDKASVEKPSLIFLQKIGEIFNLLS